MNVRELKHARVLYLTGQIEGLNALVRQLEQKVGGLNAERARFVEHLGYNPARGESDPEEDPRCDHKWRDYGYGYVCRDCGTPRDPGGDAA